MYVSVELEEEWCFKVEKDVVKMDVLDCMNVVLWIDKRVRCCIMLRIIGVFLYLPLLLIVLSPCNLYSSSTTIVMSTWNFYTLHTTTLYYILHAESYNTIPGGRVTAAGWCIDMTWYDIYVMQMARLNGCMYGIGVSVERLVTSVPIDYAFGRCRMGSRGCTWSEAQCTMMQPHRSIYIHHIFHWVATCAYHTYAR